MLPTNQQMKLLIAVDFGTTFSGVAYLQTFQPQKYHVIQDWGTSGGEGEKVPTILKYDNGPNSTPRFGFQVHEDEDSVVEWFKLNLYPHIHESDLARRYPIQRPRMSETECRRHVVNYLKALRSSTETHLIDHFGRAFWRSTPREYIITVPAIWDDKSKNTTLACAEEAGMGRRDQIQIVAEPEAAGIYALQMMQNIDLEIDDTFVICDAGGGTVDLVSYTVKTLRPIPQVDEAARGSGALCGAYFLNLIFAEYLKNKFANYYPWQADPEYQKDAIRIFEKDIKKNFTGDVSRTFSIRVRGLQDDPNMGIKSGLLEIPGRDIKTVFEPVVREIIKCVEAQITATNSANKRVKAVLLAGGFGRNEYLRSRLKSALNGIDVRKVVDGNTSIVQGALIHGLAKKDEKRATFLVNKRIARRSYGTRCWVPLGNSNFDRTKTQWTTSEVTGEVLIDVMNWFLKQGMPAGESDTKRFPFYVDQPVDEGPLQPVTLHIISHESSSNIGPPKYPVDIVPAPPGETIRLNPDFRHIPPARLNRELGQDGRMYYKVYFEVGMTLRSASLHFTLIHNNFEFQNAISMEFI